MKHRFLKYAAALAMAINAMPVITAAAEEPVTAEAVSAVSWCGNVGYGYGTYPLRSLTQVTLHYPSAVTSSLTAEDFNVVDTMYQDKGLDEQSGVDYQYGNMDIDDVVVDGSDVTLYVSTRSSSGILASSDGNFRRRQYTFVVTQNTDILGENDTVLARAGETVEFDQTDTANIGSDEFEELVLTSETAGNNIYAMYYLPEDYDASQEYPMVIHVTGGSQQYRTDSPDTEIYGTDNFGVELDIDLTPSTFSVNAPEDTIMVTVQAILKADDQPEGYDSSADMNQVVRYFEENYAVDEDRVYAIGNSQGGLIMSGAVDEDPSLYAAYLPCNTSIYYGTKKVTEEDTDSEIYQGCLKRCENYASEEVAVWINSGRNDFTGSWLDDQLPYVLLKQAYAENGYSEEEINDLVHFTTYENEDFEAVGSAYYHGATGLMCQNQEVITWLYQQTREDNSSAVTEKENDYTTVYCYDASVLKTEYSENGLANPVFLIYPDHALTAGGAENLIAEMGLFERADEECGTVYVINPIEDEYTEADAEAFVSLLDVLTPMAMNTKLIGIGDGATFVNNELNDKLWSIAGVMVYGGEAGGELTYAVPAYVSGSDASAYKNAADPENDFEVVAEGTEGETLAEAFANAWDEVFVKNGRIGNITGTFYTMPTSTERPFEYFTYLNCETMGIERTVVNTYDFDEDGVMNLWYEYVPESAADAPNGTVPVVVMLHGNTNDPRTQANTSGWSKVAAENGIILIEPEWQGGNVSGTVYDAMTEDDSTSEENDIIKMLEEVEKKYPQIDTERIYVEGLSRGSVNSIDIGITYSDVFAAVGAHSAGTMENFYEDLMAKCTEDAEEIDTPIYMIAGAKDQFLPLTAKGEKGSMLMAIQCYEELNDFDVTSFDELTSEDPYFGIASDTYKEVENSGSLKIFNVSMTGDTGVEISLNAIENWGHWNYEPAAELMWEFFSQHTLNEKKADDKPDVTPEPDKKSDDKKPDDQKTDNTKKSSGVNTGDSFQGGILAGVVTACAALIAAAYFALKKH